MIQGKETTNSYWLILQGLERSRSSSGSTPGQRSCQLRVHLADGLRVQGLDPQLHPRPGHAGCPAPVRRLRQEAGHQDCVKWCSHWLTLCHTTKKILEMVMRSNFTRLNIFYHLFDMLDWIRLGKVRLGKVRLVKVRWVKVRSGL